MRGHPQNQTNRREKLVHLRFKYVNIVTDTSEINGPKWLRQYW